MTQTSSDIIGDTSTTENETPDDRPVDTEEPDTTTEETGSSDENEDSGEIEDTGTLEPDCYSYHSSEEDYAPIQTTGSLLPDFAFQMSWKMPTDYTSYANFSVTAGDPANH